MINGPRRSRIGPKLTEIRASKVEKKRKTYGVSWTQVPSRALRARRVDGALDRHGDRRRDLRPAGDRRTRAGGRAGTAPADGDVRGGVDVDVKMNPKMSDVERDFRSRLPEIFE